MGIELRVIKKVGQLKDTTDFSYATIAKLCGIAPNSVRFYCRRYEEVGLTWENVKSMDDVELISKLKLKRKRLAVKAMPNWQSLHERLSRNKHLTLEVLHEEYRSIHKENAYAYSQFTHYYREYLKKIDISMRLTKVPGEVMQVDFAGTLIPWNDPDSGEQKFAQIFVSVLGYSSYTFACAVESQKIRDFINGHIQAFSYIGGVTESVVIDNLKAGVTTPGVDPILNPKFEDFSQHMGFVALSTRVRKPQDKGSVEQAVRLVSRWITAKLLDRNFFSIEEINEAIFELLPGLNKKEMRNYEGSRLSRFQEHEQSKLKPLPSRPYRHFEYFSSQKIPKDYHIKVLDHFYSVPYTLVSEIVDIRASDKSVEISCKNKLVAIHPRSFDVGGVTTDKTHMAPQHLAYSKLGLDYFSSWAESFGPAALAVVKAQYEGRRDKSPVANQACAALRKVSTAYEKNEFEAACARAVSISSPTLKSVKSILRTGLFKLEANNSSTQIPLPLHDNVRGSTYYQTGGA